MIEVDNDRQLGIQIVTLRNYSLESTTTPDSNIRAGMRPFNSFNLIISLCKITMDEI
jgi:hypothetical protein